MTLNEEKGTTISELEAFFVVVKKLLNAKLEENPKAGIIMAKGKKNEAKFKYKEILEITEALETMYANKGCFSFGICKTCGKFETDPYISGRVGKCKLTKAIRCIYDSCDKHTMDGGGFGL